MILSLPKLLRTAAWLALIIAFPGAAVQGTENISPLGRAPDWPALERFQGTMTQSEFTSALQNVYCTRGVGEVIQVEENLARFLIDREEQKWFTLRFAPDEKSRKRVGRRWKRAAYLPRARKGRELAGLKIALDPGHIGGKWAQMEERWFQVGDSKPIQEGDLTLRVAKLIAPKLRKLGASVSLVRPKTAPVTKKRPADLTETAKEILLRAGVAQPREDFAGPADPEKEQSIRWQDELLFYRNSEIRERARIVNTETKPDVVLCLHFNAESWEDPRNPTLVDRNHLHLLINGSYLPAELEFDDVRFEMLQRLLSRTHEEEFPLAEKAALALARRTQLPPYEYTTENVAKMGSTGYVFARNLIATRLYRCPVIYFEPYVMNSDEVFWRVQEGDYEGIRSVNGIDRPSIFREYADGVVEGLVDYYREAR
ncbi:MAG: N-acetylmuramoyl-L-alanine amidase [Chthoniobacterales bacterium]|nr:N-acetylmuramoyl-L-alanine amidase [Chthoniobacterales bacterium]